MELTRRNIPFVKFGGLKFLEAAHIKDMLALLRFVENPRDRVAGFRVMQLMPGVGPTSAQRVLDRMMEAADPIGAFAGAPSPPRAGAVWTAFVETVTDVNAGQAGWPAELERTRLWYEPHLDRIHEDSGTRHADLIQLEQIANGYPSRERFLTELTLDPPDATSDQAGVPLLDEDYLILSTIHSAKGQEWKSVFVLNVVDGCIPSDLGTGTSAEIEEERRLLYVAMTRAKDDLHLIVPQRFFTHGQNAQGDRHVYASRTRFLPDGLLGLFERTAWPMAAPGPAVRPASEGVRVDVGARLRGMWRWGRSAFVQSLFGDEGPAGNPRIGGRHARPDRQSAIAVRDLPGLLRPDCPKPTRGSRADDGAVGDALARLCAGGQKLRSGCH